MAKGKFTSLEHNGPVFPEEYKYAGKYTLAGEKLLPLAEEMMMAWSKLRETDYVKDSVFQKNFYKDLKAQLTPAQKALKFPADYTSLINKMYDEAQEEKAQKAEWRKANKETIQKEKDALKEKYGYAILDGKKQPLGMFMIEPPGIMMSRGNSPSRGMWKYRTTPEDVTINFVGDMKKCPQPPVGHTWKCVENNTGGFVTVKYKVNIGNTYESPKKFIFGGLSDVKQDADQHKYEKAAVLVKNWDKIEKHIENGLKDKDPKRREAALISWLILRTGIRVGSSEIADNGVVGASTLKVSNITVK